MLAVKQQRTVFKSSLDLDVWSLLLLLHTLRLRREIEKKIETAQLVGSNTFATRAWPFNPILR